MPPGVNGTPIDKVGYHGFVTWDLEFHGVRAPARNQLTAGDEGFASTPTPHRGALDDRDRHRPGLGRGALGATDHPHRWRDQRRSIAAFSALLHLDPVAGPGIGRGPHQPGSGGGTAEGTPRLATVTRVPGCGQRRHE